MPARPESVKKRSVWINDDDWTAMGDLAQREGKTISVLMRDRVLASNGKRPAAKGK